MLLDYFLIYVIINIERVNNMPIELENSNTIPMTKMTIDVDGNITLEAASKADIMCKPKSPESIKIDKLERHIDELEEEIACLNDKREQQEYKILMLESDISQLKSLISTVDNLSNRIDQIETRQMWG